MALTEFEEIYPTEEELAENRDQNVCQECGRQFSNKGALRMHSVKTHQQLDKPTDISLQSRIQRIAQTAVKRFHCPKSECSKVYEKLRNLAQHFQKVHCEKRYKCADCGNKFALERDLRYHSKQRCPKTRDNSAIESKSTKPKKRSKKVAQSTQTECIVIKLVVSQRAKTTSGQTQTEEPMSDYPMNSNYSTSDFAGQYDHAAYNDYAQR
jgi:DNA-directed RNA polymerase subunit RPC12/RpoP